MWTALSHGRTLGCLSRESQLGAERASNVGATHFSLLWLWIWWDWLLALPPWLLSGILSQKLPFLRLQLSVRVSVMATEMKLGQWRPACCYCCHLLALFEPFYQNHKVFGIETAETDLSELQGSGRFLNRFGILWQPISGWQGALLAWSQRVGEDGSFESHLLSKISLIRALSLWSNHFLEPTRLIVNLFLPLPAQGLELQYDFWGPVDIQTIVSVLFLLENVLLDNTFKIIFVVCMYNVWVWVHVCHSMCVKVRGQLLNNQWSPDLCG